MQCLATPLQVIAGWGEKGVTVHLALRPQFRAITYLRCLTGTDTQRVDRRECNVLAIRVRSDGKSHRHPHQWTVGFKRCRAAGVGTGRSGLRTFALTIHNLPTPGQQRFTYVAQLFPGRHFVSDFPLSIYMLF